MAKEYWVKCDQIEPGMFPRERSIYITQKNGQVNSGFIFERQVDEQNCLVRAYIVNENETDVLVENPSWSMFGPNRFWVCTSQIVEKEVPD